MGIVTKYVCDKCDHEQKKAEQMWYIGISRRSVDSPHLRTGGEQITGEKMWCRACVENLHILPRSKEDEKKNPAPPVPTLEDMIRGIAREEIQAQ